jgi:hypothetical protein
MPSKTDSVTFKKAGRAQADFFDFTVALDAKDRKQFLRNPRAYFRGIGIEMFGRNNGVAIDATFLAEMTKQARQHKGRALMKKRGVKCHIPQGPRACKIIIVRSKW